jgi:predicted nucleic acid-binding protein
MIFADLTAGDSVFLDANTFIYHFGPDPILGPPCSQLLQRIENQELTAFTSSHVLAEVVHKLMTIEANAQFGWPMTGMANRLRRHPADVQKLSACRIALDRVCQSKISLLGVSLVTLQSAAAVCRQTGLLINDGLIVALMQQNGLTRLASHDADFDRVPGLARFAPA